MFRFTTPRAAQGQTVEYAYARWGEDVYRRIADRSDSTVSYWRSRALAADDGDDDSAPANRRWRRIGEDQLPSSEE